MKYLLIALFLVSCTSDKDFESGKKQLTQQGYTDISKTGYEWLCCSKDDSYSTGFKAKAKDGSTVTGCFCSGNFKGVTVRFND